MTTPAFIAAIAFVCLAILPEVLRNSTRFDDHPRAGLVTWVALGLVGWSSVSAFFIRLALGHGHQPLIVTVWAFLHSMGDGHPLRGLGIIEVVGLSIAFDLGVLVLGGLGVVAWKITGARLQQRTVLDLVGQLVGHDKGYCLLDHPQPIAYFLPGDGGRIVLSTGTLSVLTEGELEAVIEHERGHQRGHHGALYIPLHALSPFVPFVPLARYAPAVMRSYMEMIADDHARSSVGAETLKSALNKAPLFQAPPLGAFGVNGYVVERRLTRLNRLTSSDIDLMLVAVIASMTASLLWIVALGR